MLQRREFGHNVQPEQHFIQGMNGNRNAIDKQIRCARGIQPGNTFVRQIRIAHTPGT